MHLNIDSMPIVPLFLFKLSLSLAVVWCFYQLVLRRLTFHALNRWYLLGYALLSLERAGPKPAIDRRLIAFEDFNVNLHPPYRKWVLLQFLADAGMGGFLLPVIVG
jgi:hypothetical protein